jgi:hypothetical protein
MLGWYDNRDAAVVNQQLAWMAQYGIDFVSIAWYWRGHADASEAPITAYLQAENRRHIPYTLMWANHDGHPNSGTDWNAMVDYWLTQHIQRQEYFQIDEKPAVFIFSTAALMAQAQSSGFTNPAQMLEYARNKARTKGLNGIYFVGGLTAAEAQNLPLSSYGLDALTAYNYNGYKTSYAVFDQGYRGQWNSILSNPVLDTLDIPYFVPMSSGADESPWNATPADNRMSTVNEFDVHVRAGYEKIIANKKKTKQFGIFCCWNEYGEGSILEPTERHGTAYLQRIKDAFKK